MILVWGVLVNSSIDLSESGRKPLLWHGSNIGRQEYCIRILRQEIKGDDSDLIYIQ